MNLYPTILLSTWLAGLLSFLGGLLASLIRGKLSIFSRLIIRGAMAFGGGLLVAAIAFALTPVGLQILKPGMLVILFCAGGMTFCLVDIALARQGGSRAQFMAMMMDFVPEAISLGAVFGHDSRLGMLLALFIGAQNLPEGFNAYRELTAMGKSARSSLTALLVASLAGPISGALGYFFLQNRPSLTASIMMFASGGILYLIFQDIAPSSKLRHRWGPALGAVFGFSIGLLGTKLLG